MTSAFCASDLGGAAESRAVRCVCYQKQQPTLLPPCAITLRTELATMSLRLARSPPNNVSRLTPQPLHIDCRARCSAEKNGVNGGDDMFCAMGGGNRCGSSGVLNCDKSGNFDNILYLTRYLWAV
eukprot:gb/GEZJ01005517.1/.p2 GENE.gb/GEZJ01005517.1/~~gb/GEZJ01005517.1/.p2  ORF type:complete len:125 (+),score=4.18 gb/GEZJ01005517.1/:878-1252(+)